MTKYFLCKNPWAEKQFPEEKNARHVCEIDKGGVYLKLHVRISSIYLNWGHMDPTSGKPINWGHNNATADIKMCSCSWIKLDEMGKNGQNWIKLDKSRARTNETIGKNIGPQH